MANQVEKLERLPWNVGIKEHPFFLKRIVSRKKTWFEEKL
jgi:hypothetical protein